MTEETRTNITIEWDTESLDTERAAKAALTNARNLAKALHALPGVTITVHIRVRIHQPQQPAQPT